MSGDAAKNAEKAGVDADKGEHIVKETVSSMREITTAINDSAISIGKLDKQGDRIGQVIEVISPTRQTSSHSTPRSKPHARANTAQASTSSPMKYANAQNEQ